jgi:transcriptional regulator with XRE-family HTH domain
MPKSLQASRYRILPPALRAMREAAGLTQRELARKLRLSHTLVHNSEVAERRVDVMEFADWCLACGMDPATTLRDLLKKR